MAVADSYSNDLGIMLFMNSSPSGLTYVNRLGVTCDCEELTTSYTAMTGTNALKTSTVAIGQPVAFTFWVRVSGGDTTVKLVSLYGNDSAATYGLDLAATWPALQTSNQSTGTGTTAAEWTLAPGEHILQCSAPFTTTKLRWEAKRSVSTGWVRIAGRCG